MNRAIVIGWCEGPDAGLRALAEVADSRSLKQYPFLAAARGHLLQRAGRLAAAESCYGEAAAEVGNAPLRELFLRKRRECLTSRTTSIAPLTSAD